MLFTQNKGSERRPKVKGDCTTDKDMIQEKLRICTIHKDSNAKGLLFVYIM